MIRRYANLICSTFFAFPPHTRGGKEDTDSKERGKESVLFFFIPFYPSFIYNV